MTPQENLRDKLRLMTKTIGLGQMVKSIGLSDLFKKIEGFDFLTEEELIKTIKECVEITDPMQYNELGITPLLWKEDLDEIHQLEYFSKTYVLVQVWGGYNYDTDEGEYRIPYENLNKDQLTLILYGFLEVIENDMIL